MKQTLSFFAIAALAVTMFSSCAKRGEMAGTATDSTQMAATNMMDSNKAATKAFYDNVMNAHDTAACDKYCSADFVDHNPAPGHSGKGMADLKAQLGNLFAAFPDVHFAVDKISADNDLVWVMYTMTGTMKGNMGPMKASNKSMKIGGMDLIQIKDGKANERWGYADDMAMMTQLGFMPPPPAGGAMQKKM